jgi:hypothetical protein
MRTLFAVTAIVLMSTGCSERKALSTALSRPAGHAAVKDGQYNPADKHGSRRLMGLDVPVFVDGDQQGVLRAGDMIPLPEARGWNGATKGFRISDYLTSIGVPVDAVKAIHLHANAGKVGSIQGSELRKDKDRFVLSFLGGDHGTVVTRWETEDLKNQLVVHEVWKVSVFVKKDPAVIDPERSCHVNSNKECTDEIPYFNGENKKGTRLYVDGKLTGYVKRRQLKDEVIIGETSDGLRKFSIEKYATSLGVDLNGIKAIDVMAGDDMIARSEGRTGDALYFVIPPHSHGKVRVHVPANLQAKQEKVMDRDALATSVHVWKSVTPPARPLAEIDEDTDLSVQLASSNQDERPHTN